MPPAKTRSEHQPDPLVGNFEFVLFYCDQRQVELGLEPSCKRSLIHTRIKFLYFDQSLWHEVGHYRPDERRVLHTGSVGHSLGNILQITGTKGRGRGGGGGESPVTT